MEKTNTLADTVQAGEIAKLKARLEQAEQARQKAEDKLARLQAGCCDDPRELARAIVEHSPAVLFRREAGDDPRLVYVSENVARFGYKAEEMLGMNKVTFKGIVHPDDKERLVEEIRHFTEQNLEEYTQEYRVITRDGEVRWVTDRTSVIRDRDGNKRFHQGVVMDVTEQRLAEEKLRKSEEKHRRILETAAEGFVFMTPDLVIRQVNDAYLRMVGYSREEVLGKTPMDIATHDFKRFIQAGKERLAKQEQRVFEGSVRAKDGRVVPILIHGNTLRDGNGKHLGHVAFVTDLTEQKTALMLAKEVQRSLLPGKAPKVPGLDLAGKSLSCDEVGGDYYDFLEPAPDSQALRVAVGDISGHGVDAALLMTSARAYLRMRASGPGSPSNIITEMNHHFVPDLYGSGRFMTLFLLSLDSETRSMRWVRAGHDPALLYTPDSDSFRELGGDGLPVGVLKDTDYQDYSGPGLRPGQVVALGTDGVWEAENEHGRMLGKDRFRAIVRDNAGGKAQDILDAVFDEVDRHTSGTRPADDVTLVVVKGVEQ